MNIVNVKENTTHDYPCAVAKQAKFSHKNGSLHVNI